MAAVRWFFCRRSLAQIVTAVDAAFMPANIQGECAALRTIGLVSRLHDLPPGRYDWQVSVIEPAARKAAFWQAPIAIAR